MFIVAKKVKLDRHFFWLINILLIIIFEPCKNIQTKLNPKGFKAVFKGVFSHKNNTFNLKSFLMDLDLQNLALFLIFYYIF